MQAVAVWEDEEINRKVSLSVDYEVGPTGITINRVTPERIDFPAQDRSIRVWTERGRRMLTEQFNNSTSREVVMSKLESALLATAE